MGIRNTESMEPMEKLIVSASPGGIEASEAQGQRQLVASEQIPAEINGITRGEMEEIGFVFGEPSQGDELFQQASLPPGWSKRPTEHSMWSEIVDDKGEVRASIFYKAAFYDRRAFMSWERES